MKSKFKDILQVKSLGRVGYISIVGLVSVIFLFVFSNQTLAASKLLNSETELIRLTNEIRLDAGLDSLTINYTLARSAKAKAYDMAVNGYFAHEDQLGRRVSYWLKNSGYSYLRAGENLARGFDDPLKVVKAWKRSKTHYANLVNKNYTEIGVGIAEGVIYGRPAVFVVQHFGEPFPLPTIAFIEPVQAVVLGDAVLGDLSEPLIRDLPKTFSPEVGPAYQAKSAMVTNESFIGVFLVATSDATDESNLLVLNTNKQGIQETDMQKYLLKSESDKVFVRSLFILMIMLIVLYQTKSIERVVRKFYRNTTK